MPFEPRCAPSPPVVPVAIDPTGRLGPTKAQAARSRWRRVAPRAYVPASVDGAVVEQRIAEAAAYLPDPGAVTGWAALRLCGAAFFDGVQGNDLLPVTLALGQVPGRRTPPGVTFSYEPVREDEIFEVHGIRVVHPVRAVFHEMRRHDDCREAVVAFDMTAAAALTSVRRLRAFHADHASWRRASRVTRALDHLSEHARSPQETRLRLVWTVDAGLPVPHVNRRVQTLAGSLVCVPDLFDEKAGLVVEYDGDEHRKIRRHASDAGRYERCRDAGLEYCTVTGPDMHSRSLVVERMLAARRRAPFTPPGLRRWILTPRTEECLDETLDRREAMARELWEERGIRILPW